MSRINIKNLTFSYGNKVIFDRADFALDDCWRTGLVGRNGRGKTTLFKILIGELACDGRIDMSAQPVYFPYKTDFSGSVADVIQRVCPDSESWRAERELSLLGMDTDLPQRRFLSLSDGEKTRVLIAALFLNDDSFPLIDEPTNHLDGAARAAVAEYLKRKRGFIVASHDRAFLDICTDHTISLERDGVRVIGGGYSVWESDFTARQARDRSDNERLEKDIRRLKESAARTADWAEKTEKSKFGKASSGLSPDRGYVGHKAAKLMKRATASKSRAERAIEEKSEILKRAEKDADIAFTPLASRFKVLLRVKDLQPVYGGKPVCERLDFTVERGERVALVGGNGSGKSSVLKIITGGDISRLGRVELASGIRISYVAQSGDAELCGSLGEYARERGIDERQLCAMLDRAGFERQEMTARLETLSQGQKKKVLLFASLCESADLYIWDEPLNFTDIPTRLQIEKLIADASPTMIFVEHDETFCRNIATKRVCL